MTTKKQSLWRTLAGMKAGEEVAFTVTVIFEHNGQPIAFEGSDTVRGVGT